MPRIPSPWDRVTWRGFKFNRRTRAMLIWVEKRLAKLGDPGLQIAQGSFNAGGVAASGGTHDGSAVDLRTRHLSAAAKKRLERVMRDAGFAAWFRPTLPGVWGEHLHAIPMDDKQASWSAKAQIVSYLSGRDGLRSNAKDPNQYRPGTRFSWLLNRPVTGK